MMDDPRNPKDNNSNATTTTDKSSRPDDESNPFISFRRYADDQIHSLMSSVMGIPATLSKEHDRWHASRQHGDQQATGSGREEMWVKQWSSEKRGDGDDASKNQNEPSCWVGKVWKPDGQEVKPEVTEDPNGGKTWHWSTSWSWPPKNNAKQDSEGGGDDLDAAQRNALDEARRNADKEMQEITDLFKGWFGVAENKQDAEQPARPHSLLDLFWPGDHDSAERREEMRRVDDGITQVIKLIGLFSGADHSTASSPHLGMSDEARDGSKILQLLDVYHGSLHSWAFPVPPYPPSYFLDYSNPRTRWMLEHPYSPAVLEAGAIMRGDTPPRYTDAFEDLMRAENGVGMRASDLERGNWRHGHRLLTAVNSRRPGTQQFWQNVERGGEWYVPAKEDRPASSSAQGQKQLEALATPDATATKEMEARDHMYERFLGAHTADPKTELDMYERFLGDSSAHHHHRQPPSEPNAMAARPMAPADIDVSASPILSTVTTTERNVAADGTVTTKVTLKKRFADGREESSETVNTSRGDANPLVDDSAGKKKNGGWFWSN